MVIVQRYCSGCKQGTPQKYDGVEVRGKNKINLYKCLYCNQQQGVPASKSPLEHHLTASSLKQNRLLEGKE